MGRRIFQSERNAYLLIDVLRSLIAEHHFELQDFVIMPDHIHALITVHQAMTIEKSMQFMKGRFSHRLKQETGYLGEIWQRGFSEIQVMNSENLKKFREYIAQNPVKSGLVESAEQYPFCFQSLAEKKTERPDIMSMAGAKAQTS